MGLRPTAFCKLKCVSRTMVDNLKRFQRKMSFDIPKKAKAALRAQLAVSADKVVASAEALVPQDEGDLLASIGWVWGKNPPNGAVSFGTIGQEGDPDLIITIFAGSDDTIVTNKSGGKFQNAKLQEFGTKLQAANPFFLPAYRLQKRGNTRRINKAIKRAIRDGAR